MSGLVVGLTAYSVGWVVGFTWQARRTSVVVSPTDVVANALSVATLWPVLVVWFALAAYVRLVRGETK